MHRRRFLEFGFRGSAAIGSAEFWTHKASDSVVSKHSGLGIRFENRQATSGVGFVLNNGTTPDKPLIDSTLGSIAVLDSTLDLESIVGNSCLLP